MKDNTELQMNVKFNSGTVGEEGVIAVHALQKGGKILLPVHDS